MLINIELIYMFLYRSQLRPPFPGSTLTAEIQAQQQQLQLLKAQQLQQMNSPKRDIRPLMVAQTMLQQTYGAASGGVVVPSSNAAAAATSQLNAAARNLRSLSHQQQSSVLPPMAFYSQPPQSYYGEVLHPLQVSYQ